MARVFVSHASEDRAVAGEVHGWLVEAGHEVFLDQDLRDGIAPGEEWEQRLHERLRWANAVICMITSAYLDSTWCAAEVGIARSLGSQLLPLRTGPGRAHPLLTSVQEVDYRADPPTARAAVLTALHRVDTTWPDDRSPFPGLRPFDTDQHHVFFGRTEEVQHLAELLRSPAERARNAALLMVGPSGCGKSSLVRAGLLPEMAGQVRVVATLRPEFLAQLLVNPELAALPTRTSTLRPLRREALRAVIERPARLAGIDVDDGLVDRLVDDTDNGEALPLLAFTLAQLADGIHRGGRLSHARYDQLGGVQGALTRQSDAALADAVAGGGRNPEQVLAGLLRLVTVDDQGRPTRWRVLRDELPTPVITELDSFVERRLLTTDEDNDSSVIGVAHEAFLSAWPHWPKRSPTPRRRCAPAVPSNGTTTTAHPPSCGAGLPYQDTCPA